MKLDADKIAREIIEEAELCGLKLQDEQVNALTVIICERLGHVNMIQGMRRITELSDQLVETIEAHPNYGK